MKSAVLRITSYVASRACRLVAALSTEFELLARHQHWRRSNFLCSLFRCRLIKLVSEKKPVTTIGHHISSLTFPCIWYPDHHRNTLSQLKVSHLTPFVVLSALKETTVSSARPSLSNSSKTRPIRESVYEMAA